MTKIKTGNRRGSKGSQTKHSVPVAKAVRAASNFEASVKKVEGLRILDLQTERLANQEIDATGIDHIAIAAREVKAVKIVGLTGSLHLGGGGTNPNCSGLVLERCAVDRLALYDAVLIDCAFVECQIHELLTGGSIFKGCKFSGTIRHGIFAPRSVTGPRTVQFEDNDFSQCDLGDVAFRGGIELSRQRFNPVQTRMNIDDAKRLLLKIDQRINEGTLATGLWDIRAYLKRSVEFKQSQVFISKEFARRFLVKYLANIDHAEREMVSSEFASWAHEIERHCGSRS